MENKYCTKCNIEKPLTEFYFRKDKNMYIIFFSLISFDIAQLMRNEVPIF